MCIPLCNHPKPDGIPCGSPAVRGKKFCYYHLRDQKRLSYSAKVVRQLDVLGPRLPRLTNLRDVQDALHEIFCAVAENRIDLDRAGRHLFRIQQISASLHKARAR
jgi:hypothetical protein